MQPFPLIEKWFREKKIFLSGPRKKVINIWKGHKTNYTRGGSCWQSFRGHHFTFRFCINFENKFLFMTPRKILSANVSRGTKKKSDAFVIGGWTSWVTKRQAPPPPLPPFYPSFLFTLPKIICIPILLCTVCWVKQNLLKKKQFLSDRSLFIAFILGLYYVCA